LVVISQGSAVMAKDEAKPADKEFADLQKASEDLKAKIAEAKKHIDMPLDQALGNPGWEQNAADGHLDRQDEKDEA
jgi:hypothetical protein